MVTIEVLGTPIGKGNARAFVNKKTGRAILSSFGSGEREKRQRGWDANVRDAARETVGKVDVPPFVDVPMAVALVFRLTRPNGHWGKGKNAGRLAPSAAEYPRGKPDADKLARATLDALTGIVFDDDARIVRLTVDKVYATPGNEGATIRVEPMPSGDRAAPDVPWARAKPALHVARGSTRTA